jgi:hypothetical protein
VRADLSLEALYCTFGRYLLILSSPPDGTIVNFSGAFLELFPTPN